MNQTVRQLDMLRELVSRKYGITVKDLSQLYGVTTRTIERDINDLSEAGFPLYSDKKGRENLWKMLSEKKLPPMNFPYHEIVALLFVQSLVTPFHDTPFANHFQAVLNRIQSTLPDKIRVYLEKASQSYLPYLRGYKTPIPADLFDNLSTAISTQKTCLVTYTAFSTNQTKTYPIDPLRLFHHHGGLYLMCRISQYDNLITLATERIQTLELTDNQFNPPQDLDFEAYIQNAFGVIQESPMQIKVRFTKDQTPYVKERIWHPTQEIEIDSEGRAILSFQAGGNY
ncbi:MAG: helix-turn-helix transcriptional regulator, partial [Candidatus Latescibacterota bacterium]